MAQEKGLHSGWKYSDLSRVLELKRAICIICSILSALCLTSCGKSVADWKEEIVSYVNDNNDTLLSVCEEWCEDREIHMEDLEGTGLPSEVDVSKGSKDVVLFEFYAEGLMTASLQGGFYYSRQNEAYNKMGKREDLIAIEDRWEWRQGDNYYITEKISDCLYYYGSVN